MTTFRFSPQMKEMILRAKREGGTTTCDPRAMYPVGHRCAATTQPITPKISPPWIPTKSTGVTIDPCYKIASQAYAAREASGTPVNQADVLAYAKQLRAANKCNPVADKAVIVKQTRTPTRDTVTEAKGDNGDTVKITTAPNGAVKKVEVQENKWLIPAAIAAAFFILGG